MTKKIIIALAGLLIGILIAGYFIYFKTILPFHQKVQSQPQIIGFLPYWLLDNAKSNYSDKLTTLTYFALNVDGNGHIVKLSNPQQEEPGWYALSSGKVDPFLNNARANNIKLSLLISSGDANAINQLVSKPQQHAITLINDVSPIMKQYHFSDLNLDIEDTSPASAAAQMHFTQFVQDIKQQLNKKQLGTLTLEISPTDPILPNLIDINAVAPYTNYIVIMAYDYHSSVSLVTGPVAPLTGAGTDLEYDVTSAVEETMKSMPSDKIILGMPLYGYEWETLNTALHSAIIPGTGVIASNNRMESFLSTCATCSAFFDTESQEEFVVYQDQSTGTYHQIFFPDQQSVASTINLAKQKQLGGVALWALGYEGSNMLDPLKTYK
jgi:spore germination protein YaaH